MTISYEYIRRLVRIEQNYIRNIMPNSKGKNMIMHILPDTDCENCFGRGILRYLFTGL